MFVVALTGGIGCGKSEATRLFAELGVPIVDLDEISRALTADKQPLLNTLRAEFGDAFFDTNGALNRAKLRQHVFDHPQALAALNAILHPAIYAQAIMQLQQNSHAAYQLLVIPLLVEGTRYRDLINQIVVIDCDEQMQIARVQARSHLTVLEVQKILAAQASRAERLKAADFVIENNRNLADLREKIMSFHKKTIKTCALSKTSS